MPLPLPLVWQPLIIQVSSVMFAVNHKISARIPMPVSRNNEIRRIHFIEQQAPFTLLRFLLDPFLQLKTELFFLPVHITPFLNKNEYLSRAVFTHVLKNGSDHLLFVFALLFFCFLIMFRSLFVISVSKFLRFSVFTLQLCVSV